MKKHEEAKDGILKRLEGDMEELRKNNTNPIFQQYINISEENAKLNKEYNLLKYKVTDIQEEHDNMQRMYQEEAEAKKQLTAHMKKFKTENDQLSNVLY